MVPTLFLRLTLSAAACTPLLAQEALPPEQEPPPRLVGAVPEDLTALLSPEDMQADVDAWKEALEQSCAGLHRYVTEEELDQAFADLRARLAGERTVLDFYREMMKVNSLLRRAKAFLSLPPEMSSIAFGKSSLVPPVQLLVAGGRFYVTGTLGDSPGLPPGSEILEINGFTAEALRQKIFQSLLAEGYNETAKRWSLQRNFPLHYLLFVDETRGTYDFVFNDPNGHRQEIALEGVPGKEAFEAAMPDEEAGLLQFRVLEGLDAALLVIRSLHAKEITRRAHEWELFLEDTFRTLGSQKVSRLVLDLRGNQEGSDAYGIELVARLVSEPFRYIELVEVAPAYAGNQDTAKRKNGTEVLFPYNGMGLNQPAPGAFTGDLIVLIDGGTYGPAADVASVLHRLKRATFVGEETGGVCDGSSGGTSDKVRLERSGLSADMPSLNYILYRENGDLDGVGVPPDHPIEPKLEDAILGEDTVMRYVRETLLAR